MITDQLEANEIIHYINEIFSLYKYKYYTFIGLVYYSTLYNFHIKKYSNIDAIMKIYVRCLTLWYLN